MGTQAGGVITARELLCPERVVEGDPWAARRALQSPCWREGVCGPQSWQGGHLGERERQTLISHDRCGAAGPFVTECLCHSSDSGNLGCCSEASPGARIWALKSVPMS